MLAGIAEFERELIQERIRSGIAAAQARGKLLGRPPGQRPKSDRLAPGVMALIAIGRNYRLIGREVGLSKTVADNRETEQGATLKAVAGALHHRRHDVVPEAVAELVHPQLQCGPDLAADA